MLTVVQKHAIVIEFLIVFAVHRVPRRIRWSWARLVRHFIVVVHGIVPINYDIVVGLARIKKLIKVVYVRIFCFTLVFRWLKESPISHSFGPQTGK